MDRPDTDMSIIWLGIVSGEPLYGTYASASKPRNKLSLENVLNLVKDLCA